MLRDVNVPGLGRIPLPAEVAWRSAACYMVFLSRWVADEAPRVP
jgi:hypothetical protein